MLFRDQWAEVSQHELKPHWYLYRQQSPGQKSLGRWMPICVLNPVEVSRLQLMQQELLGPFESYQEAIAQIK